MDLGNKARASVFSARSKNVTSLSSSGDYYTYDWDPLRDGSVLKVSPPEGSFVDVRLVATYSPTPGDALTLINENPTISYVAFDGYLNSHPSALRSTSYLYEETTTGNGQWTSSLDNATAKVTSPWGTRSAVDLGLSVPTRGVAMPLGNIDLNGATSNFKYSHVFGGYGNFSGTTGSGSTLLREPTTNTLTDQVNFPTVLDGGIRAVADTGGLPYRWLLLGNATVPSNTNTVFTGTLNRLDQTVSWFARTGSTDLTSFTGAVDAQWSFAEEAFFTHAGTQLTKIGGLGFSQISGPTTTITQETIPLTVVKGIATAANGAVYAIGFDGATVAKVVVTRNSGSSWNTLWQKDYETGPGDAAEINSIRCRGNRVAWPAGQISGGAPSSQQLLWSDASDLSDSVVRVEGVSLTSSANINVFDQYPDRATPVVDVDWYGRTLAMVQRTSWSTLAGNPVNTNGGILVGSWSPDTGPTPAITVNRAVAFLPGEFLSGGAVGVESTERTENTRINFTGGRFVCAATRWRADSGGGFSGIAEVYLSPLLY